MKVSRELRHILGRKGEDTAVRYLEDQDFIILNRNWRTKAGELDIVALDGNTVVFVEVKTRSFRGDLDLYRTVSLRQIRRNRIAAQLYMRAMDKTPSVGRFDLIEIVISRKGGTMQISHRVGYQKPLYGRRIEESAAPVPETEKYLSPAVLFPCPLCRQGHSGKANSFCPECLHKLPLTLNEVRCPDCGEVLGNPSLRCEVCVADGVSRHWDAALYLMDYSGGGKELIRSLKYGGRVHLARSISHLAAEVVNNHQLEFDAVCAVPMPYIRQMMRSFNQADLIAERIAVLLKLKHINPFARFWFARPQSMMNMRERAANRKKRYRIKSGVTLDGMRLLLIDDVYTTGATLEAAAKVLKKAGAFSVTVLTCAHTPRYRKR